MEKVDVRQATHVECPNGKVERIVEKIGVGADGRLNKPSEGGFGVRTESGQLVSMWQARAYFKDGG